MTPHDVSEFIIAPPLSRRQRIIRSRERLAHYLRGQFPEFEFRLIEMAPVGEDDDFVVLPVMNFVGDDGKSHMCKPVPTFTLVRIREALRQFERTSAKALH